MRFFVSVLFLFSWLQGFAQTTEVKVPALTSPVVDLAGFLSEAQRDDLSSLAYEIYTNKGPQITVLTVPDLQGFAIEDFSIRVAEKWQLGTKEQGNGILVVISKEERQVRIEVGEGIEGDLTDYETTAYTRDVFPRYFKAGDFHGALRMFMEDVAKKFNVQMSEGGMRYVQRAPRRHTSSLFEGILPFLVIGFVFINMIFRRRPFARGLVSGLGMAGISWLLAPALGFMIIVIFVVGFLFGMAGINNMFMGRGGGFGGGFGGGGGGWGGGGGGFSGGGSSGSW